MISMTGVPCERIQAGWDCLLESSVKVVALGIQTEAVLHIRQRS